jgi:hypothetical protein
MSLVGSGVGAITAIGVLERAGGAECGVDAIPRVHPTGVDRNGPCGVEFG